MVNKRFIYFVNSMTCKSKNIFIILFYYFYYLKKIILNISHQNHNKLLCFYIFSYDFNFIMDLTFCLVKIFNF